MSQALANTGIAALSTVFQIIPSIFACQRNPM
jgi:hypothetical protein